MSSSEDAIGQCDHYIEFPVLHWHFDPVLNASVMTAHATMRVYMFHGYQFCSPVVNPFFYPHYPHEDITLDDVWPPFHPLMYSTNGESNSNTCLTPTCSIESDPSEPMFPFVIYMTSNSSSSATSQVPPPRCGWGFICTRAISPDVVGEPVEECAVIMHPEDSGTFSSYSKVWGMMRDNTCEA